MKVYQLIIRDATSSDSPEEVTIINHAVVEFTIGKNSVVDPEAMASNIARSLGMDDGPNSEMQELSREGLFWQDTFDSWASRQPFGALITGAQRNLMAKAFRAATTIERLRQRHDSAKRGRGFGLSQTSPDAPLAPRMRGDIRD